MIQAIEKNLQRSVHLLNTISEDQYSNKSVAPYYSSIGGHIRHIMDVFDCFFEGYASGEIDLTARKRNALAEENMSVGLAYVSTTIAKINAIANDNLERLVNVTDDLGTGKITAKYTVSAMLIQAHSHAIHHYASIGYIIHQLGIELPDDNFGFNPTTPKKALALKDK